MCAQDKSLGEGHYFGADATVTVKLQVGPALYSFQRRYCTLLRVTHLALPGTSWHIPWGIAPALTAPLQKTHLLLQAGELSLHVGPLGFPARCPSPPHTHTHTCGEFV